MELEILDSDKKLHEIFGSSITLCDNISVLDAYHFRKFFGINLPHRILGYILLKEKKLRGKEKENKMSPFINERTLCCYIKLGSACIKASFFSGIRTLKEFYGCQDTKEAYDLYNTDLTNLMILIAKKTRDKGDTFERVLKYETDDFIERINKTESVINRFLTEMTEFQDYDYIDEWEYREIKSELNEIIKLLHDIKASFS